MRDPISLAILDMSQKIPVAYPAHLWTKRKAAAPRHRYLTAAISDPPSSGIAAKRAK
jgi:hypothetical protein